MASNPPSLADQARTEAFANGRYHADREAHLDLVHRWIIFAVIVLGASALVEQFPPWVKAATAASTAALGAFDLLFMLVERARAHAVARERYFEIAADLCLPNSSVEKAQQAMLMLAGKEEPPYLAAHALAENWAKEAVLGAHAPPPLYVSPMRKMFRHWARQDGADFANASPAVRGRPWWGGVIFLLIAIAAFGGIAWFAIL
ncbi:MAG TPA: hypothetical protein VF548_12385 [Allosphingosinicella sp.]